MVTSATVAKPRVFISSTIHDFADLRDALRFWLEELGFEVQLSEHTDFERCPEAGTFEACFEAIRESDYYLLLIGKRRGSWYKEADRRSVTRQEYQCALEAFENSAKPRIVAAVRADVLTALRERHSLGSPEGPSTLEDWQFTDEFIREVRREEEVAAAVEVGDGYPAGNWLSIFRDFRELVSVLRSTLAITGPLPRVALLEAVRRDCEQNLRELVSNHRGRPFYQHWWLNSLRKEVVLRPEDLKGLTHTVSLTYDQIKRAVGFLVASVPSADQFVRVALDEAVASGRLLDYDRTTQRFVRSSILTAIYLLREELSIYSRRLVYLDQMREGILGAWALAKSTRSSAGVPTLSLFALYALHDTIWNIVRLLMGILRHIYGHTETVEVQLRPHSPIAEFEEEIRRETVTEEQLETWLREDHLRLQVGMADQTEEQRRELENLERRFREAFGDEADEILQRGLNELLGLDESDRPE